MDPSRKRPRLWFALVATLVTGCAGASPASSASPGVTIAPSASTGPQEVGTVVITDADCTFEPGADQLQPGPAELAATNNTDAWAGVHMWRILEGHTYDELAAYVAEEHELAEAGEPGLGHPDFVGDLIEVVAESPGTSAIGIGTLRSATYGLVCARMSATAGEPRPFTTIGPIEVAE